MTIELDLHGLTSDEAVYKIQREIVNHPECTCLEVIHGFNNGNTLKGLLKNKNNIHNKRVLNTCPCPFNMGRTLVYLKKV